MSPPVVGRDSHKYIPVGQLPKQDLIQKQFLVAPEIVGPDSHTFIQEIGAATMPLNKILREL